ncbi:MAG: sigma-70 family RNA polymerase sigma factor [Spirochaetes bacterium]|nr:sigma-70 family RNA polymerase sigma factor [Spirochaetota bacterium]
MTNLLEKNNLQDQLIIKDILSGKTEEFRKIVDRYKNMIYGLVLKSITDIEDAEDLVQDIFHLVYQNLKRFNLEKKFHTWLYTISVNAIRNHLKKKRRHISFFHNSDNAIDSIGKDDNTGQNKIFSGEIKKNVMKILSQMKDKYRIVLVLHYFEDLNIKKIAEILDLPDNTVKTHLKRAREEVLNLIRKNPESETFFKDFCTF